MLEVDRLHGLLMTVSNPRGGIDNHAKDMLVQELHWVGSLNDALPD